MSRPQQQNSRDSPRVTNAARDSNDEITEASQVVEVTISNISVVSSVHAVSGVINSQIGCAITASRVSSSTSFYMILL
jgi:hypothetical protein